MENANARRNVRRQLAVIGGWTEPHGSRPFFDTLLLGVYDDHGQLHYIGQTRGGFTDADLGRVWKRLHALKTRTSPFHTVPRTTGRAHWVKPLLVADVKFTDWTSGGKLRHATFVGLRDDVRAHDVRKGAHSSAAPHLYGAA
jgi:bifunctional non-homologous end joining protein LigD